MILSGAAHDSGDAATARTELARAAHAIDYHEHAVATYALLRTALDSWNPPAADPSQPWCKQNPDRCMSATRDEVASISIASVVAMQYFSPQAQCLPKALPPADASLRADCIAIYRQIVERDRSYFAQTYALATLVRLTSEDADGASWRERYRRFVWTRSRWQALVAADESKAEPSFAEFFRTMLEADELPAMQAMLFVRGVATDPPADWMPDKDYERSLIQTGHVPTRH